MVEQEKPQALVRIPPANQVVAAIEKAGGKEKVNMIRGALVLHLGLSEKLADALIVKLDQAELLELIQSQLWTSSKLRAAMRQGMNRILGRVELDPGDSALHVQVGGVRTELPTYFQPFGRYIQEYLDANTTEGNLRQGTVRDWGNLHYVRVLNPSLKAMKPMKFVERKRRDDLQGFVRDLIVSTDSEYLGNKLTTSDRMVTARLYRYKAGELVYEFSYRFKGQ